MIAAVIGALVSGNANAATKTKGTEQVDANLSNRVICPNFDYNVINICKDILNGNVCYYSVMRSTTKFDRNNKAIVSSSLSCVKAK